MKKILLSILSIIFACNLFAATVDIYRDKTIYKKIPKDGFIGFNKNVQIKCGEELLSTFKKLEITNSCYLCSIYSEINKAEDDAKFLKNKSLILQNLAKNISLQNEKSLSQIDKIAKEMAKTEKELKSLNFKISRLKSKFKKGSASNYPFFINPENCDYITLIFPGVDFQIQNKLIVKQIADKKAKIELLKLIKLTNKSGIDISATNATLHFKNISSYQKAPIFNPWIIYAEMPVRTMFKSAPKGKKLFIASDEKAEQQKNRIYTIKNLHLISDGKPHSYILTDTIKIANYRLISYPYISTDVFREISFDLASDIESNKWKVKVENEIFTDIRGTYENGKYKLFAGKVYDIKISREKIIDYKESAGFFGGKKKISDGYKIVIDNVGTQSYHIAIIDRIPISNNEKIKIENVKVSDSNCQISDKGKLVCDVDIEANTKKEISVTFDIVYDKDLDIVY